MTLRKSMPLFLVMLTVMYALPVASAGVVVNPPAFAQSSSLAQDIIDSAQQETDSSSSSAADDNVLDNNNEFGDDDIPVIDQENTAEQDAANLGLQDQEQEATQEDFDVQVGESVQ